MTPSGTPRCRSRSAKPVITRIDTNRAESLGMQAKVGIAERSDRLVFTLVTTGLAALIHELGAPHWILWATPIVLGLLAVASSITVIQRIFVVHEQATAKDAARDAAARI